ncbi:glutaredoxin 3 [Allosediminivita pacifica]|uniref:Glutaredoxin n=1 Tax=Allosediminivita pacifica TaxID=1267769 RepID=A0A2T6B5X6_9RHOB|nr:glutaredoxin 3 [Allosediminivita pacifica]PTX51455.1 glutaredoxin 3 [Allosediminivita pacifica]GGA99978.1 glutaredoxin 3 [Allosediminivita pacifica]
MQKVEIYTTPICGFCHAAKRLLSQKGVAFTEIDVMRDQSRKSEMMDRAAGRHTVPQIFVGDTHVGGCDELYALDRDGKLDPLLAG